MGDYIYSIILLMVCLSAIELRKSYHAVPKNELRFRAQNGDALASKLYTAAAYEFSLEALLWLIIVLSTAGSLILFNRVAPIWLDFIAVAFFIFVAFAWLPKTKPNRFSHLLALITTPAVVKILNYLQPLFSKIEKLIHHDKLVTHSGLYDKKNLIKLLKTQSTQSDNRISEHDLALAIRALKLSDKKVANFCLTWSKVHNVQPEDTIGPVLLDEMHKSNQAYIPVVDGSETTKVVGIIDPGHLNVHSSGQVKDYMDASVNYIDEEGNLEQALRAFSENSNQLLIVTDKKQHLFGIISLKEVLNQLIIPTPSPQSETQ